MANFTDPYSILNPETNSDSPSAKSKGVRLSSATQVINQGIIISSKGPNKKFKFAPIQPTLILGPSQNTINLIRMNAKLISYEIVCAAARNPPRAAYLLLDPHPAPRRG